MAANPFIASGPTGDSSERLVLESPQVIIDAALDMIQRGIPDDRTLQNIRRDFDACQVAATEADKLLRACRALILINHFSDTPSAEHRAFVSDTLSSNQSLQYLVVKLFLLPSHIDAATLEFADFGTTSIILKAQSSLHGLVAIKLLKPRYWDNERLTERTLTYKEQYDGLYRSPRVYESTAHWMVMAFVDGTTLYEWVKKQGHPHDKTYYRRLTHIFAKIFDALEDASSRHDLSHLDLNPKNIMIERREGRTEDDVWLIDFGMNYAVTERVGPPGQYAAVVASVEAFVPPETFHSLLTHSEVSDAYSVGMLLISALVDEELSRDSLGASLIELWRQSPGLAEYVEQLIDRNPDHRLVGCAWRNQEIFSHLRELLQEAMEFLVGTELELIEREPRLRNAWHLTFGIWMSDVSDVRLRGPTFAYKQTSLGPPATYYKTWAAVALLCHHFVLISFLFLTLLDLSRGNDGALTAVVKNIIGIPFIEMFGDWYQRQSYLPVHVGDTLGNLPGRLVCLSFSVLATRYYLRIFSLIFANTRNDLLCRMAESVVRLNSFSFLIPISITMYVQPKWWPFCVAVGIMPVVLNNRLIGMVITRAHREGEFVFSTDHIQDTARFLKDFDLWWNMMLIYASTVFVFGSFLVAGRLKDEMAYALIVLTFNYAQIVRIIIGQLGYEARGGIKRLLFLDRRLGLLQSHGSHY